MNTYILCKAAILAGLCGALAVTFAATAPAHSRPQKGANVTLHAKGTFEVQMTPQPGDDSAAGVTISRTNLDKQFHGELEGASKVQMLGTMTSVKGSAGYVAMERFTGTLAGRAGGFVLQHSGTMNRGTLQLSVTIVPDSGSGQLTGIYGSMTIEITEGKHYYDLAYTLPENP
jgi:hypothetical protein